MENEKNYLEYLAELYPTIEKAATEIINLQSVINLPKGTEHFLSDIHGEYEAFSHVLRNGSGAVRKKIDDVFARHFGKTCACNPYLLPERAPGDGEKAAGGHR